MVPMSFAFAVPAHAAPQMAGPDVLQINGLCRFSYPSLRGEGFRLKAGLYEAERLRQRLWLFESLCLPSLLGQSEQSFRLILLAGENLPQAIAQKLRALVAPHRNIFLHFEPEGQSHGALCQKLLRHYRDPQLPFTAEFNMDDDDAVAKSFIADLRRNFAAAHLLMGETGHIEMDFCRGFAAQIDERDIRLKHVLAPHWGVAQAFLMPTPEPLTAMNFHHMRYWKNNNALSLSRRPMFLRSFHAYNDSATSFAALKPEKLRPREGKSLSARLRQDFALALAGSTIREEP